jgi:hypothetical protein
LVGQELTEMSLRRLRIVPAHSSKLPTEARRESVDTSRQFIGGKRMERLGIVEAVDQTGGIDPAAALFGLDNAQTAGGPILGKVTTGAP